MGGKVLVEPEATIELEDVHLAQILNYLKAYRIEVGLVIDFGSKSLPSKDLYCNMKPVISLNL